jgi:hypothetical protein
VSAWGMKQKKSKKQDKRTLASVVKEMAQPRFAKSARTGEEKTPGDDKAKAFVAQNVSEEVGWSPTNARPLRGAE